MELAEQQQTTEPAQTNPIKKGDVVWVMYRKKPWPARVTAFYPKERKVSYVFFPLHVGARTTSVFKTEVGKVYQFKLEDELPADANAELEESYNQARRILEGVSEEEVIADYTRRCELVEHPKQKTTLSAALKKTPKKATTTPKQQKQNTPARASNDYKAGDPIIVNTDVGMWPGLFGSYIKGDIKMVNYSLFPRQKHLNETLQISLTSIHPFPGDQLESLIEDQREGGKESEMLLEALIDVRSYLMKGRKAESEMRQPVAGESSSAIKTNERKPLRTPKEKNVEAKPKQTEKAMSTRKSSSLAMKDVRKDILAKNVASTPPRKRPAIGEESALAPAAKKVKTEYADTIPSPTTTASTSTTALPIPHSPVKQQKTGTRLGGQQQKEQLQQLGALVEQRKRTSKEATRPTEQQQNVGMEEKQPSPLPQIFTAVTTKSPFELAMSEECRIHLEKTWQSEGWFDGLAGVEELCFDYKNGGLFNFLELDKLIAEVQKWIKLSSPRIPALTYLNENYVISKHVLPEIGAFVLAKQNNVSLETSKRMYKDRCVTRANGCSPNVSPPQNSLNTLLMAATLKMAEEEQNGTVGNASNGIS